MLMKFMQTMHGIQFWAELIAMSIRMAKYFVGNLFCVHKDSTYKTLHTICCIRLLRNATFPKPPPKKSRTSEKMSSCAWQNQL